MEGNTPYPVVEEELQIGKRVVRRGGVRVYSRVVEQPVEENVSLREEHVRVERRPVNRPAEAGDTGRLREQSIEVTEMAEEPVVQKRTRVREEVVVGKETKQRTREGPRYRAPDRSGSGAARTKAMRLLPTISAAITNRAMRIRAYLMRRMQPAYDYGYRSANDSATRAGAGPT